MKNKFSPGDEVIVLVSYYYVPPKAKVISNWLSGKVYIDMGNYSAAKLESELEHVHVFYSPLYQTLK